MNVEHQNECLFYEIEAENEGWDVKHLKRQIHTFLFEGSSKAEIKRQLWNLPAGAKEQHAGRYHSCSPEA